MTFLSVTLLLAGLLPLVSADTCASDPYADPKNDPCNPLGYIPSNALTFTAFAIFAIIALVHTYQAFRWRTRFMAAMVVGLYTYSIGFIFRYVFHNHPQSKSVYIAEYLLIVLSPCLFIASDYSILGRLASHIGASEYLAIPARRITTVFVVSDIVTFLIQALGGSVSVAANDKKGQDLGNNLFLTGLILQLVSFIVFTLVYLRFLQLVYKHRPALKHKDAGKPFLDDWRSLALALLVSCGGILIRSVYRTIEAAQGFGGSLSTSEAAFYFLDTLPLFIAVVVYVPSWPGRYINIIPKQLQEPIQLERVS